jgi:hypothetical protein
MKFIQFIAFLAIFASLNSAAYAQTCGLCAKRVVVVPSTAPCLNSALAESNAEKPFVTFDLSRCGVTTATRGIVPGLPTPQVQSERPTVSFIIPRGQLACLRERFTAAKASLDPFAVIYLTDCE